MKQECKVYTLNTCSREFQRQAHSNRLREKALRDTHIRIIHEVEELKRSQEMRIDEFSRNELRESHATIQELTSQIQELQERMNYTNDTRQFQGVESICSGNYHTFPVNQQIFQVFVGCWGATQV